MLSDGDPGEVERGLTLWSVVVAVIKRKIIKIVQFTPSPIIRKHLIRQGTTISRFSTIMD